jgi:hypothetical protein
MFPTLSKITPAEGFSPSCPKDMHHLRVPDVVFAAIRKEFEHAAAI